MDIQQLADAANRLDEPADDVLLISARAPKVDLHDGEGNLTPEAESLEADILNIDFEALEGLQDEVDDIAAVGPLMKPETFDPGTTNRMERRVDAFVEAHQRLREATWDKERYEALSDLADAM